MCDGAVDDSLATLKLIPDQFLTSKMIKKNFIALYANENMLYVNEDSGTVVFNCNGMNILNINLNNIDLDNNVDKNDPPTINLIRLLSWHIEFEKGKALKKIINEELMPIAWHSNRWWDCCVPEYEKK